MDPMIKKAVFRYLQQQGAMTRSQHTGVDNCVGIMVGVTANVTSKNGNGIVAATASTTGVPNTLLNVTDCFLSVKLQMKFDEKKFEPRLPQPVICLINEFLEVQFNELPGFAEPIPEQEAFNSVVNSLRETF